MTSNPDTPTDAPKAATALRMPPGVFDVTFTADAPDYETLVQYGGRTVTRILPRRMKVTYFRINDRFSWYVVVEGRRVRVDGELLWQTARIIYGPPSPYRYDGELIERAPAWVRAIVGQTHALVGWQD